MSELYIVRLTPNQEKMQANVQEKQTLGKVHHDYIEKLVTDKVVKFGGPIEGKAGGMLIVSGTSLKHVVEVFDQDPMIKNQYLNAQINKWTIRHGKFPEN